MWPKAIFCTYVAQKGNSVLTKRSTHVDQNDIIQKRIKNGTFFVFMIFSYLQRFLNYLDFRENLWESVTFAEKNNTGKVNSFYHLYI